MHRTSRPQNQLPILIILIFGLLLLFIIAMKLTYEPPEQRVVLLSFDVELVDDPDDVVTLAEILEENGITGTFFVTGKFAEKHPACVKRLASKHEIAAHSYSHPVMTRDSRPEQKAEILIGKQVLEEVTGKEVVGFRAPYNRIDAQMITLLKENGFVYDASIIADWHMFYPRVNNGVVELPVSSVIGIPLEDVVWLHYLPWIGKRPYFYMLKHKSKAYESFLFHPHHIIKEKDAFRGFITALKEQSVIFISHAQLAESHGG